MSYVYVTEASVTPIDDSSRGLPMSDDEQQNLVLKSIITSILDYCEVMLLIFVSIS